MRKGFTLAEVLITLGIIGVVAALTMPALISNYRKNVVVERLKKFYTVMNQAVLQATEEYGDWQQWDVSEEKPLIDYYLKKYLKLLKTEQKGSRYYYYFPDGSMVFPVFTGVTYSQKELIFCPVASRCEKRGTEKFIFVFNTVANNHNLTIFKNPIEPYAWIWSGKREDLFKGTFGCSPDIADEDKNINDYCATLIMIDGWKISKDYPFRF